MSERLSAILRCLGCPSASPSQSDEKLSLISPRAIRPASQVADDVVSTLQRAEKNGEALHAQLDAIVGVNGWTQHLAEWVLEKLSAALQSAHERLGPVVREAYQRAWEAARSIEGFVVEHPVFCTVIALGVLVTVAPWVLEALGFAALGPVEGRPTMMPHRRRFCSSRYRFFRCTVAD
jgi:ElaB/YqjD/DUF883 family membrane-anchored ribosome-binding protein